MLLQYSIGYYYSMYVYIYIYIYIYIRSGSSSRPEPPGREGPADRPRLTLERLPHRPNSY